MEWRDRQDTEAEPGRSKGEQVRGPGEPLGPVSGPPQTGPPVPHPNPTPQPRVPARFTAALLPPPEMHRLEPGSGEEELSLAGVDSSWDIP